MPISQRIRTVGGGVLVSVALYISGLLVIFTPLPLLYVAVIRGRRDALLATMISVCTVAAVYVFVFPLMSQQASQGNLYLPLPWLGAAEVASPALLKLLGVGTFGFFAAVALALGEGVWRRWNLMRWGGTALAAGLAVIFCVIVVAWASGGGVTLGAEDYLRRVVEEVVRINAAAEGQGANLTYLADHAGEVVTFLFQITPSLVFVFVLFAVVLNLVVGRRLIRKTHAFRHVHNIARFRLPDAVIWGLVGSGVAFFLDRYIVPAAWMRVVALNGLIVFAALYFFQGMAVVVSFLQGVRFPLVRTLAYVVIIIFFQTISVIIAAMGVADVWIDFRQRRWKARNHA